LLSILHDEQDLQYKETYTAECALALKLVNDDELVAAQTEAKEAQKLKGEASKCHCLPWGSVALFYSVLNATPFQYDYCGEHYAMFCCERLGAPVVVKKSNEVKRKFWNFWKIDPRSGCRCESTTRKYFDYHHNKHKREMSALFITHNAKAWKPRRLLRGFQIVKAAVLRLTINHSYRTKIVLIREQLDKLFA
jgi:hypothetical protein